MKAKLFVAQEIQYFVLRLYSFTWYIYYINRGFNHLSRAFNLASRAFSVLTGGLELVTRGFELVTCRFELLAPIFELITRNLYFTFPLTVLTPKRMFQRLPIALAHVKTGNASENLLSEIRQIIYSFLYQAKEITKKYTTIR